MRDIKFRAFLKADGRIYEVLSVDFLNKEATLWDKETAVNFEADFDEITLMQYTGMDDINENEIYEGDIIKYDDMNGEAHTQVIRYDDENGAFCCDRGAFIDHFNCMWEIEVLGNIYENKEILKDTK